MIPPDGRWIWRFDTRSNTERIKRYINEQKFYTNLPHELDQAEAEFHEAQPEEPDPWHTIETGTFGEDGWSISTTYKPSHTDD